MATVNLFNKAKKVAPKTAKKDEKVRVRIDNPDFFQKIQKLEELNDTLKSAKAKADMINDEVRDISKEEWIKLYSKTGKNPGSIFVEAVNDLDDTAQVMFVPTDRYITVNEERAEELQELYGEEIVTEDTTFSFDSLMIEKYGEVLSRLIEECEEIDEDDKERIIKATTKFSVAKGTIDKMKEYGDVEVVMEAVKPVVALKNIEVVKG
jgi:hypothetical protein